MNAFDASQFRLDDIAAIQWTEFTPLGSNPTEFSEAIRKKVDEAMTGLYSSNNVTDGNIAELKEKHKELLEKIESMTKDAKGVLSTTVVLPLPEVVSKDITFNDAQLNFARIPFLLDGNLVRGLGGDDELRKARSRIGFGDMKPALKKFIKRGAARINFLVRQVALRMPNIPPVYEQLSEARAMDFFKKTKYDAEKLARDVVYERALAAFDNQFKEAGYFSRALYKENSPFWQNRAGLKKPVKPVLDEDYVPMVEGKSEAEKHFDYTDMEHSIYLQFEERMAALFDQLNFHLGRVPFHDGQLGFGYTPKKLSHDLCDPDLGHWINDYASFWAYYYELGLFLLGSLDTSLITPLPPGTEPPATLMSRFGFMEEDSKTLPKTFVDPRMQAESRFSEYLPLNIDYARTVALRRISVQTHAALIATYHKESLRVAPKSKKDKEKEGKDAKDGKLEEAPITEDEFENSRAVIKDDFSFEPLVEYDFRKERTTEKGSSKYANKEGFAVTRTLQKDVEDLLAKSLYNLRLLSKLLARVRFFYRTVYRKQAQVNLGDVNAFHFHIVKEPPSSYKDEMLGGFNFLIEHRMHPIALQRSIFILSAYVPLLCAIKDSIESNGGMQSMVFSELYQDFARKAEVIAHMIAKIGELEGGKTIKKVANEMMQSMVIPRPMFATPEELQAYEEEEKAAAAKKSDQRFAYAKDFEPRPAIPKDPAYASPLLLIYYLTFESHHMYIEHDLEEQTTKSVRYALISKEYERVKKEAEDKMIATYFKGTLASYFRLVTAQEQADLEKEETAKKKAAEEKAALDKDKAAQALLEEHNNANFHYMSEHTMDTLTLEADQQAIISTAVGGCKELKDAQAIYAYVFKIHDAPKSEQAVQARALLPFALYPRGTCVKYDIKPEELFTRTMASPDNYVMSNLETDAGADLGLLQKRIDEHTAAFNQTHLLVQAGVKTLDWSTRSEQNGHISAIKEIKKLQHAYIDYFTELLKLPDVKKYRKLVHDIASGTEHKRKLFLNKLRVEVQRKFPDFNHRSVGSIWSRMGQGIKNLSSKAGGALSSAGRNVKAFFKPEEVPPEKFQIALSSQHGTFLNFKAHNLKTILEATRIIRYTQVINLIRADKKADNKKKVSEQMQEPLTSLSESFVDCKHFWEALFTRQFIKCREEALGVAMLALKDEEELRTRTAYKKDMDIRVSRGNFVFGFIILGSILVEGFVLFVTLLVRRMSANQDEQ